MIKTIFVLCEASKADIPLLEQARIQATAFNSRLYLIHVAAPDPDFVGYDDVGPQHERDWRADSLREEHRQLQLRAEALIEQGIDAVALLLQGSTVTTVLNEAERLHADMLIIGDHQRGTFHRILSGSDSAETVRQAHCPVLIVPLKD